MDGYGEIVFPHCQCDARKGGYVIASLGFDSLKLHACNEHGVLEVRINTFMYVYAYRCPRVVFSLVIFIHRSYSLGVCHFPFIL